MKVIFITLLLAIAQLSILSAQDNITHALQSKLSSKQHEEKLLVWVFFTSKGLDKVHSTSQAKNYISEQSIQRRQKISDISSILDITDLPVNGSFIKEIEKLGFTIRQKSKWLNGVSGYVPSDKIVQISSLPFVKEVDLVNKYKQGHESITDATEKKLQKSTSANQFDYGNSLTQMQQINVPAVHDLGITGKGINIGVFDAGFSNLQHEAFSRMHIIAKWDFVNNGPNVGDSTGLMGEGSHGTATLSAIGGFKEGKLIGPAFDANYILAKTENTDSETPAEEDNWIAALEWADSIGVDIISSSLGYLAFDKPYSGYTWADMNGKTTRITRAAALAARKGIVVVNSAGNEGEDSLHNTLGAPADADTIITVGAVNSSGIKASFSSIGPTIDGRIKPDVMAMGVTDFLAARSGVASYSNGSGTSFSCPITAGVAALVLSANNKLNPVQVRDALRQTASKAASPDKFYGWGIIDALEAVNYAKNIFTADVNNKPSGQINDFVLNQNYPNPFNPSTNVTISVPKESDIRLELYNILGVKISEVFQGHLPKGQYSYKVDGSNLASGFYFIKMSAGTFNKAIKIVLEK
ncbi:MAG: S8 family serine peptidase [Methanococcaceae archaeon]